MVDRRFYTPLGPLPLGDLIVGMAIAPLEPNFLDVEISAVAGLAGSRPGELAFFGGKKYRSQLETAKASACLTTSELAELVSERGIIPLITATPRAHFGRLISRLSRRLTFNDAGEMHESRTNIHSTAIIAGTAQVDRTASVGPFAVIGPGVVIGARTRIGAYVQVDCSVIGEDCTIKAQAVIGGQGFGVDKDEQGILDMPHIGRVIIGDRVSIGSQSCIDRGLLDDTVIDDDVKIDNLVQIAHNVRIGAGSRLAAHVGISGSCHVGRNVVMGGNVGLADHLTIGDGAALAARAGVMHNVPAGEIWSGIPAQPIRDHMKLIAATRKLIKKS